MPALTTPVSAKPRRLPGTNLPTHVFETSDDLARNVAQVVAAIIRDRGARGQQAVLGLPTGSTPVGLYRELVRMHRDEGLDFSHVVVFVLNEFYGIQPDQAQSHNRWMREHLLDHVNVLPANVHIPGGTVPLAQVEAHCREFEAAMDQAGGIDV